MTLNYLFVAILASAVSVLALQNSVATSIRFLVWSVEVPLAGVIFVSAATGIILVAVPLLIDRWRLRSRALAAETRLARTEALTVERDQPLTSPSSVR